MDYSVRAAEESKLLREGEEAISPKVECRSALSQPQVCSQASHLLHLQPRIPEGLSSCLHKAPLQGVMSVPYTSRGLTNSGKHLLYVKRKLKSRAKRLYLWTLRDQPTACQSGMVGEQGPGKSSDQAQVEVGEPSASPLLCQWLQWHTSSETG